eukprot:32492_1
MSIVLNNAMTTNILIKLRYSIKVFIFGSSFLVVITTSSCNFKTLFITNCECSIDNLNHKTHTCICTSDPVHGCRYEGDKILQNELENIADGYPQTFEPNTVKKDIPKYRENITFNVLMTGFGKVIICLSITDESCDFELVDMFPDKFDSIFVVAIEGRQNNTDCDIPRHRCFTFRPR